MPELLIILVFIIKPCRSVKFTSWSMKRSRLLLRDMELLTTFVFIVHLCWRPAFTSRMTESRILATWKAIRGK